MLNGRKGVSLVSTIITIVVMSIIIGTLTYSAIDSVKIRKLNKLYNDLRQLQDAVEMYYLQNGKLPVNDNSNELVVRNGDSRESLESLGLSFVLKKGVNQVINQDSFYNPNDYDVNGVPTENATYKFIKLDLLDNLSLNYKGSNYIVNTKSHTVYNYTGVMIDDVTYHNLLLNYIDTEYKENHKVTNIRLRNVPGMTNVTSTTNEIYFAYSEDSINLKDYLIFDSAELDGLGKPKSVTFEMKNNVNSRYYTLDRATGILNRIIDGDDISNTNSMSQIVATATSYGTEDVQQITLDIHMASINVYSDTPRQLVEYINLATNRTGTIYQNLKTSSNEYIIQKNGILNSQNSIIDVTSNNSNVANATYTNNKVVFNSGTTAGRADVTFEVQNYGFAKDTVIVSVYDLKLCEDENTNDISELNFTGIEFNETKDIYLNIDGPKKGSFNDGRDAITWSEVRYNNNQYVEYNSGIINYAQGSGDDYNKITIIPKQLGTTYMRCRYMLEGEILGEIIIPVRVLGCIEQYNALNDKYEIIENDTITFNASGDSTKLNYVFEGTPDGTVSYIANSSNFDFNIENLSDGEFKITYNGTSSETTTEVTIIVTVVKNNTEKIYSDKIVIRVSSFLIAFAFLVKRRNLKPTK